MADIKNGNKVNIVVTTQGKAYELTAYKGERLRNVLLRNDLSPHVALTSKLNCGGNGICATCGVWLQKGVKASHWHDKLAKRFSYPRLSCQVVIEHSIKVELVDDKKIWGKPNADKTVE